MARRKTKSQSTAFRQQHQAQGLEARFEQEVARRPSGAPPLGVVIVKENVSTKELGSSGLSRWGGTIDEEFLNELRGSRGRKVYTEMRHNDPVVAAMLRCITWLCRSVDWDVNGENEKQVEFVHECMDDCSHSWDDFISEALTFLPYGWSLAEIVYKYRKGEDAEPPSKYDDGRIGWRKLAFRSQLTLWEWDMDDAGGIRGMVQSVSGKQPVNIPIEKALLFRTTVENGNPEGQSILRSCYRSWLFKKNLEEIEGIGLERNLNGLPVLYLGEGANTDANREKGIQIVRDVRKDAQMGIVLPGPKQTADGKGWLLELLSGGSLESADVGPVITRYEKRIALSMLAQWLMLGMDQVGSYALSQDQTDFFRQAVEAVLKMITSVLNRFAIPRLFKLNPSLQKTGELPTIEYSLPIKPDFKMFAEAVNVMVGAGILKAEDQTVKDAIRGLLGLPEEEELPQPEEEPVNPDPAAMMQAAAATAQQPAPEVQKPMPPEMVEQQGKLKEAAEAMGKGGPGSGNYGHAGIPGQVGGSAPGGGGGSGGVAYTVTDKDLRKAETAKRTYEEKERWIEENKAKLQKQRRYGLEKRDNALQQLKTEPEYYRGIGQARYDRHLKLDYAEERLESPYNLGYYRGWTNFEQDIKGGLTIELPGGK